jgi:hypothetical protein
MTIASGTRILTARGDIPVDALRLDDAVETVGGDFLPVVFLGYRRIDCGRHPSPREVWPVRVRADAFAAGVPARDLLLSPDHAVFIGDMLIPLYRLINGATIVQEPVDEVVWRHVELPGHDVMFAESLPCESHPNGNGRIAFQNGGRVIQLHPRFTPSHPTTGAPAARAVAMIRRYLLERAWLPARPAETETALGNTLPG